MVQITRHALERLACHHPDVDVDSARALVSASFEVDRSVAAGLLFRRMESTRDVYLLTPDRRGLLVLVPKRGGRLVLITYLRFQASQVAVAERLYPLEGS